MGYLRYWNGVNFIKNYAMIFILVFFIIIGSRGVHSGAHWLQFLMQFNFYLWFVFQLRSEGVYFQLVRLFYILRVFRRIFDWVFEWIRFYWEAYRGDWKGFFGRVVGGSIVFDVGFLIFLGLLLCIRLNLILGGYLGNFFLGSLIRKLSLWVN